MYRNYAAFKRRYHKIHKKASTWEEFAVLLSNHSCPLPELSHSQEAELIQASEVCCCWPSPMRTFLPSHHGALGELLAPVEVQVLQAQHVHEDIIWLKRARSGHWDCLSVLLLDQRDENLYFFLKNLIPPQMCTVTISRRYQIHFLHFCSFSQVHSHQCHIGSIFASDEVSLHFLIDLVALLAVQMLSAMTESCKSVQLLCQQPA